MQQQFDPFGQGTSVNIVEGKRSGVSRGFGFVKIPSPEESQTAAVEARNVEYPKEVLAIDYSAEGGQHMYEIGMILL